SVRLPAFGVCLDLHSFPTRRSSDLGSKILLEDAELVVGVDANAEAIDWAQKHFRGPQFICGAIEDEPWTGKFETVVSLETTVSKDRKSTRLNSSHGSISYAVF